MSKVTIYVSCHCKTFNTSFDIPLSAFPLKSSLCHCNPCRYSSGHVFGTFMVMPLPYSQTPSTQGLKGYQSSDLLTRWFCQTCGARCWNDDRTAGESRWELELYVGLVDRVEVNGEVRQAVLEGLLDRVQMWVADTGDGGASVWVNGGLLEGMDRRETGRESRVVSDEMLSKMRQNASKGFERQKVGSVVSAKCHCSAVDLLITFEDEGEKAEAGLDACESCRKVTGSEITAWFTVPMHCVATAEGSLDLQSDVFGRYSTSEGVLRYFCIACGATIFYEKEKRDSIDIAAGLLRGNNVRTESWLDWNKYGSKHVAFVEDSVDRKFVDGLVLGSRNASGTRD